MDRSKKQILTRMILCLSLAYASASWLRAQNPAPLNTLAPAGVLPTGSYSLNELETIDNVNGSLFFRVPMASLPPGRAGQTASLPLLYNSNLYNIDQVYSYTDCDGNSSGGGLYNCLMPSSSGGWQYGYEYGLQLTFNPAYYYEAVNCSTPSTYKYYQLSAVFPDGSSHLLHLYNAYDDNGNGYYQELPGATASCSSGFSGDYTYYTTDGTYVKVIFLASTSPTCGNGSPPDSCWSSYPWTMYFPDGTQVTGAGGQASAIFDRNGNKITVQNIVALSGSVTQTTNTVLTDDLGRTITVVHKLSSQPGQNIEDDITQTWANSSTLQWTVQWAYQSLTNTSLTYPCFSSTCYLSQAASMVVSSITFPTTPSGFQPVYQFSYADSSLPGWGQLNNVILPSGATVHYNYRYDGQGYPWGTSLFPPRNPITTKTLTWCDESDQANPLTSCSPPVLQTNIWNYSFGSTSSQVTGPDGGTTVTSFFDTSTDPNFGTPMGGAIAGQMAGLVFKVQAPDCSTVERQWGFNTPYLLTNGTVETYTNPFVAYEFHSVAPAVAPGSNCSQVSPSEATVKYFTYDSNGNVTMEEDTDWIPYGNIQRGAAGDPTSGLSGGTVLRTVNQVPLVTTTAAGTGTDDANGYWHPGGPALISPISCRGTTGGANGAMGEFTYDGEGNLTQERDWDSTKSPSQPACSSMPQLNSQNAIVLTRAYDSRYHGNLVDSYDGNGNDTHYNYDSNGLYVTSVTVASQRTTNYQYEFNTGLLLSSTDYNGLTRTYSRDNFGRVQQLTESGSSGALRETTTTYEDGNRRVVTYTDAAQPQDQLLRSTTDYDQLGRVRLTRQLESGSQNVDDDTAGIKVQTRYGYGSPWTYQLVSNPYRAAYSTQAGGESTMGWTLNASDAQHGTAIVTHAAGTSPPSLPGALSGCADSGSQVTCASNTTTTTVDEAGVTRTNTVDGMGRLISVVENSLCNSTVNYGYDVLGNLTSVNHAGYVGGCSLPPAINPSRTFVYDSLSRLSSATNAESATTSYTYDNDSNLHTRTDGQGRAATFSYDALNRLTGKSYNDSTPGVTYSYFGAEDFLSSVSSSSSTYSYSNYDALGRPGAGTQTTNGQAYPFSSVAWTPQGQISSITYPSGRVVTTSFDAAARPVGVSGAVSNGPMTTVSV